MIERLTELRNTVDASDFTLMKYNLKLIVGYFPLRDETLTTAFEQPEMKKLSDAASTLNEEIIAKHGYCKLSPHLDFFKLTTTGGFFDIDDFNKLQRKYTTGKDCDPVWAVRVRLNACQRFEDLKEFDSQHKHFRIIATLLEGDKYKSIPFGQHLKVIFLKKQLHFVIKLKKFDEARS